jgi:branched-chain amino acid transport system substrate-binding protein
MPTVTAKSRGGRALRVVLPGALGLTLLAGCGSRLTQAELTALNHGSTTTLGRDSSGIGAPSSGERAAVDSGTAATAPVAVAVAVPRVATPAGGLSARPGPQASTPSPAPGSTPIKGNTAGTGRTATAAVKTDNKPITICSVSELDGPPGAAIAQGVNGLQAWVGDVNAGGGVNGHQIRLLVKDSGSDPNVALAEVRGCVENDGAVALVGSMATLTAAGYRSYLESKGVPSIGGDCGSSVYNESRAFVNQCAAPQSSIWAIAYEAAHAGTANNKFGFLYCQEARACADGKTWIVDDQYATKNGLDLAYTKQISLTQLDFTSECSAMKAAGVTTAMAIVDPSGLQRMGQSCARQGFNPRWVQLYASVNSDTQTKPGLGNIRLQLPTMPFCCLTGKDAENPTYKRYVTAFARYGGSRPAGPAAPLGWTAGLLFERFLDVVGKTEATVSSAALMKAAGGIRHETLGGLVPPINLTSGAPTPDSKCWFVMQATDGGAWQTPNGLRTACRP